MGGGVSLRVDGVYAWYESPERPVLRDVTVSFSGGVNVLLGPNGSGKTTLLRVILGVHLRFRGEVLFSDGEWSAVLSSLDDKGWARWRARYVGVLPQEDLFFDRLTVLDNVVVALRIAGLEPDLQAIRSLAESLGISHLLYRRPGELSGGERRKAGLLRALAKPSARVLVLDEPTSSLDSESAGMVAELLSGLSRDKLVIVATHDPILSGAADRRVYLRAGRVERVEEAG